MDVLTIDKLLGGMLWGIIFSTNLQSSHVYYYYLKKIQVSANVSADISCDVSGDISAAVCADFSADVSADISTNVSANATAV